MAANKATRIGEEYVACKSFGFVANIFAGYGSE
jgi:hypothetical protein